MQVGADPLKGDANEFGQVVGNRPDCNREDVWWCSARYGSTNRNLASCFRGFGIYAERRYCEKLPASTRKGRLRSEVVAHHSAKYTEQEGKDLLCLLKL